MTTGWLSALVIVLILSTGFVLLLGLIKGEMQQKIGCVLATMVLLGPFVFQQIPFFLYGGIACFLVLFFPISNSSEGLN
jgi:hypothetical protein